MPDDPIHALIAREGLPAGYRETAERLLEPLCAMAAGLSRQRGAPVVLGLCGSQGCGKTTAARGLVALLETRGLSTARLSIDDLYLTLAERQRLAGEVHPLFRTRGVPGTHDVPLGLEVLGRLKAGQPVALPRFDKASDDRAPKADWPRIDRAVDVVIFEGWCVGARPQGPGALAAPVNALERYEDPEGVWRRTSNAALAGPYQDLFAMIDRLVLMAAPSFEVVLGWRLEQEHELKGERGEGAGMTDAEVKRFISFYERLTRHILAEMPARADVLARLGEEREVLRVTFERGAQTPLP